MFLCVRRKVKRERESEREREKSSEAKSSQNTTTKKKKKERTLSVIFGVKAFFSILIKQRRESTSVGVTETPQNKNKSSSNLAYK